MYSDIFYHLQKLGGNVKKSDNEGPPFLLHEKRFCILKRSIDRAM